MVGKTETIRTTESDNSWTTGKFEKRQQLKWLHVNYTSTATAGNRQIRMELKDVDGNIVMDIHAGTTQAASLTYGYTFLPGIFRETSVVDNSLEVPIPIQFIIDPNHSLTVRDVTGGSGVDVADSMVIGYQLEDV